MSFCTQPWAVDMPMRTKAQRAARLARAKEEADLMRQRRDLYREMWHASAREYSEAARLRSRLEARG